MNLKFIAFLTTFERKKVKLTKTTVFSLQLLFFIIKYGFREGFATLLENGILKAKDVM